MLLSYARVSTARQGDEDKFSLPDQLRKNRAAAQMHGIGKDEIDEFVDNGISGGTQFTKRPEGGRLWSEMKPGDIVVAAKLDRMFRSARDALTMLERFREAEVKVILLDIGTDPIGETAISEAFFGFIAIFANLERRMINERTLSGRANKKAKNGYLGAGVPYGWQVRGQGKTAILLPVESEQKIVDIVVRHCQAAPTAAGIPRCNLTALSSRLAAEGYFNRDGKPFFSMQLKRINDYETARRQIQVAA